MVDYSLDRKHVGGAGEEWRSGGLPTEKILELTPSRKWEKALLQNGI